jgi:hypothetical protein
LNDVVVATPWLDRALCVCNGKLTWSDYVHCPI